MNVLVSGGGNIGRQLARLFRDAGHRVSIIEKRADRAEKIAGLGPGVSAICGDSTDPEVMQTAGAKEAHVFVAATGSDEANMLSCFLAKLWFGIGLTIARVNDPRNEHMFTPEYGCDAAISYSDIIARMVLEETSYADVVTLLKLRKGQLTLVEGEVHQDSLLAGKTLADAGLPHDIIVVAVLRGDETLIARGNTRILPGDKLVALTTRGAETTFGDLLK